MFKTLNVEGSEWVNKEARIVNMIDLKLIVKFLKSRLMPTTHTTTVSQDRLLLFFAIVKALTINIGKVIE